MIFKYRKYAGDRRLLGGVRLHQAGNCQTQSDDERCSSKNPDLEFKKKLKSVKKHIVGQNSPIVGNAILDEEGNATIPEQNMSPYQRINKTTVDRN